MKAPLQAPVQETQQSDALQRASDKQAMRGVALVDNRPSAVAQRKLQAMINNSPRVLQQKAQMEAMQNSPRVVAQRQKMEALFGGAVQRKEGEISHDTPQATQVMDDPLQAQFSSEAPAQLAQAPAAKPNNTGLPDQLKSGIESMSGMSMDHVKVHYNSSQPAQLNAHAYAQGSDIHLAPGQEKHLPHEAWHVVQQAQGRVRPTMQMKGDALINDDPSLENEADSMGKKASKPNRNYFSKQKKFPTNDKSTTIQPMFSFIRSLIKRAPTPHFPRLLAGSQEYPLALPIYKLEHKFSGYQLNGSFNARPGACSSVTISFLKKTEKSMGFKKLFQDIEDSASELESTEVNVTLEECKPEVVIKIEKHAEALGWRYCTLNLGNGATGPTIFIYKKITKSKQNSDS